MFLVLVPTMCFSLKASWGCVWGFQGLPRLFHWAMIFLGEVPFRTLGCTQGSTSAEHKGGHEQYTGNTKMGSGNPWEVSQGQGFTCFLWLLIWQVPGQNCPLYTPEALKGTSLPYKPHINTLQAPISTLEAILINPFYKPLRSPL